MIYELQITSLMLRLKADVNESDHQKWNRN